jgi:F-type H+-transporting ATPase subunit c
MRRLSKLFVPFTAFVMAIVTSPLAFAADGASDNNKGLIGIGAALAIGLAALGGGMGQGRAAASALDGIARNPQASGKIFTPMIIALALTESLVLLAFVVANGLAGFATK